MIDNDRVGGKEMVRSSGGRSFQRRGAVMDIMSRVVLFRTLCSRGDIKDQLQYIILFALSDKTTSDKMSDASSALLFYLLTFVEQNIDVCQKNRKSHACVLFDNSLLMSQIILSFMKIVRNLLNVQ